GRITALRILFKAFQTNRGKFAVQLGIPQPRVSRFSLQKKADCLIWGSSNKWRMTGEQMIKYRAESIDVRGIGDPVSLAISLFRVHITWRAQHFSRAGDAVRRFHQSCQTKVCEMRLAFRIHQDVPRLNVPMQDSMLMCIVHCAPKFSDEVRRLPWVLLAPDSHVKWFALDQFHAEIAGTVALADFVDGNDAGMIETRCRFGFQMETFQVRVGCPLAKAKDFQCYGAIETFLSRSVHNSLPTTAHFLEQLIIAKVGQHS